MRHSPAALAVLAVLALAAAGCDELVAVTPSGHIQLDVPVETSVVVAADGSVLAELHAEQDREIVALDQIPEALRDAVVAVEDRRFYEHSGVDARALVRALVENTREGRVTQGGSTITQQLAKNALAGTEQTVERKLEEASIALQLEADMTKDEILERYLNTVYFGQGTYGAQTATQRYFGVDVGALTLPQAALLAGMLKAPSTYDPYRYPETAIARRNLVLQLMADEGYVDQAEAAAAQLEPLGVVTRAGQEHFLAPYFVDHVLDVLQHDPTFDVLGTDPAARAETLFGGGIRVETTLDWDWQQAAERAIRDTLTDPEDPSAALVAVDPATGGVQAIVGGRDFYDETDPIARFNLATDARRQPGSAFKSMVLAAALAQGRALEEVFPGGATASIPIRGATEAWEVANYDRRDLGELTLREATAYSVNVVYARLIAEVGPEAVATLAEAAGVRRPLQPYLSLALGAQEVSPLEMASVQATLAAGGIWRPPSVVTRVLAADGTVLYERGDEVAGERVMDEAVAWLTTTALEGVVDHGTGTRAYLQRPTAGKTGTTQDATDAWFAGYTPDLAAAVWIGFPEGRVSMVPPRTRVPVEGGSWPAEIFARFGLRALADTPARDFPIPDVALTHVRVDVTRDCLPNPFTPPEDIAERAYLTGSEPTEVCTEPTAPPTVDVPSAVGLPLDAAVRLLQGSGFTVVDRPEFSYALPPGYVVRQDPAAGPGQTLAGGYVVTIFISSTDRTPVEIPDVLGMHITEARPLLEEAGFVVDVTFGCPDGSEDCPGARNRPGQIWEQSPADAQAPVHSVVRLAAYPTA